MAGRFWHARRVGVWSIVIGAICVATAGALAMFPPAARFIPRLFAAAILV